MNFVTVQYYTTPFGELILGSFRDRLCLCDWKYRRSRESIDKRIVSFLGVEYVEENSEIVENTICQLKEYFDKKRNEFTIPLLFCGTEFQQLVWNELLKIPYGKTATYLELAKKMKNEKAIRAIASANGANALSILVPCHRIIGSSGELTGYAGGIQVKQQLLDLESPVIQTSLF